jgi:hypothetical protein
MVFKRFRYSSVKTTPIIRHEPQSIAFAESAILWLSAIVTVFMLGWVFWFCRFGIDLTDESFYLVWLSNPFNYSVSVTQFGFIYHPLYQLFDGNIAELRQTNILITFLLAWILSNIFLKTVYGNKCLNNANRIIIAGAIATASLVFLSNWIPAPSYNSLTLQALLVASIGLLLSDNKVSRASLAGWSLIGIGGWLAFMAKPTTASALGLCSGLYLLAARKFSLRLLLIPLVTAFGLVIVTALTIDGSIIAFANRLIDGLETARTLLGCYFVAPLFRLDDFQLSERAKYFLAFGTAIIGSAAYLSQSKNKATAHGGTILSLAFALTSMALVFGVTHKTINAGCFQVLLLWAVPLAAFMVGFALYRFKGLLQISRYKWTLSLSFLVFPYLYAFGTSNNYWLMSSHSGIFWVLSSLVLLSPGAFDRKFPKLLLSLSLAVQLVTVVLIHAGIEAPYRQPQALHKNNYKLDIRKAGSTLILPDGFGQYFSAAINTTRIAGFQEGMPMIDLTGQSPGILYAIGASNIGTPWTLGGYPGSDKFAVEALNRVSCEELSIAWLLVEPEGPRKISKDILSRFGADLHKDFEVIGTIRTAEGAGGYQEARLQQVLKPVRSSYNAMTACEAAKATMK